MAAIRPSMQSFAFAILLLQQLTLLEGKVQTGTLKLGGSMGDSDNWQFVGKFGYSIGSGDYWVRYKLPEGLTRDAHAFSTVEFNVIMDEEWPRAQAASECSDRNAEVRKTHDVTLAEPGQWSSWEHGTLTQNIRPHIWYFVTSKCKEDLQASPLHLDYEIVMQQSGGSEFSVEMQGMLSLNFIVLLCLVAFLVHYYVRCKAFVSSAGQLHQVILVLTAAIALQFVAQSLHTLHLWSYQSNGSGIAAADVLSEVLFMLSQVVQTALLIAIAMGYTLLPCRNDRMVIVKWVALMALVIHAALVGFGKMQDESACKYHENEGAVGWVLLSVRLLLFAWFLFATQATQQEGGLRLHDFLQKFRSAGSIYFLAYPLLYVVVQVFAPYLQHPLLQVGLLVMQTASIVWLAELFLSRGTYFKVSALSCSFLPSSQGAGAFDKAS